MKTNDAAAKKLLSLFTRISAIEKVLRPEVMMSIGDFNEAPINVVNNIVILESQVVAWEKTVKP